MKRMMRPMVERGDTVIIRAYKNRKLRRIVVAIDAEKVFLTTKSKLRTAEATNSEPDSIGFPIEDLVRRI